MEQIEKFELKRLQTGENQVEVNQPQLHHLRLNGMRLKISEQFDKGTFKKMIEKFVTLTLSKWLAGWRSNLVK